MEVKTPVSVLVAPLDWGLGHATRCIPIIHELIKQGVHVMIASSGAQENLLKSEFPGLEFIAISGYQITYKPGIFLKLGLILKIPAILRQIRRENRWLAERVRQHGFDAVISDNRFGLYHKRLTCIFITHQLQIRSGLSRPSAVSNPSLQGLAALRTYIVRGVERKLRQWNYRFIERFSGCWVPDWTAGFGLAGWLSHADQPPRLALSYMGILSRMEYRDVAQIKNSLLVLISGPEPERTRFEKLLLDQLTGERPTVIVRGVPGSSETPVVNSDGVRSFNHISSHELNQLMLETEYIVARSGYSTIMDLVKVKKSAILIPTPGQTEQEYLAEYVHENKWMLKRNQGHFNLEEALQAFRESELKPPEAIENHLPEVVSEFIKKVQDES